MLAYVAPGNGTLCHGRLHWQRANGSDESTGLCYNGSSKMSPRYHEEQRQTRQKQRNTMPCNINVCRAPTVWGAMSPQRRRCERIFTLRCLVWHRHLFTTFKPFFLYPALLHLILLFMVALKQTAGLRACDKKHVLSKMWKIQSHEAWKLGWRRTYWKGLACNQGCRNSSKCILNTRGLRHWALAWAIWDNTMTQQSWTLFQLCLMEQCARVQYFHSWTHSPWHFDPRKAK